MDASTTVCGEQIVVMAREPSHGQVAPLISASLKMIVATAVVKSGILISLLTMVTGATTRKMVKACLNGTEVQSTRAASETTRCTARAHSPGKVALAMRVNGAAIGNMARAR